MRILFADDDERLQEVVRAHFRDHGHEVETATDAMECIATLHDFTPDVLVLERNLQLDGCHQILMEIQANSTLSRLPVVLLVEDPLDPVSELASTNVVASLRKPFGLRELTDQIVFAVHTRSLADAQALHVPTHVV